MIKLTKDPTKANAITHAGTFHADDVFSAVFLSKIKDITLCRVNEIPENLDISDKIVFDIGLQEFDHHGTIARVRDNGVKYSAFGLLFERFGKSYIKKNSNVDYDECYKIFLKEFIVQIDAFDNGIFQENTKDYNITTLSNVIELFNKTWLEEKDNDAAFEDALQIGEVIFERIAKRIFDKMAAKELVEQNIDKSDGKILILDTYMPFMDFLLDSKQNKAQSILYAIFPSNRGGYNIRAINKEKGSLENRLDFPKEWGGKRKDELVDLTNIQSFRFCHSNLFLCSCDTLEDAIKLATLAINKK